jgi:hypothetical protein
VRAGGRLLSPPNNCITIAFPTSQDKFYIHFRISFCFHVRDVASSSGGRRGTRLPAEKHLQVMPGVPGDEPVPDVEVVSGYRSAARYCFSSMDLLVARYRGFNSISSSVRRAWQNDCNTSSYPSTSIHKDPGKLLLHEAAKAYILQF